MNIAFPLVFRYASYASVEDIFEYEESVTHRSCFLLGTGSDFNFCAPLLLSTFPWTIIRMFKNYSPSSSGVMMKLVLFWAVIYLEWSEAFLSLLILRCLDFFSLKCGRILGVWRRLFLLVFFFWAHCPKYCAWDCSSRWWVYDENSVFSWPIWQPSMS